MNFLCRSSVSSFTGENCVVVNNKAIFWDPFLHCTSLETFIIPTHRHRKQEVNAAASNETGQRTLSTWKFAIIFTCERPCSIGVILNCPQQSFPHCLPENRRNWSSRGSIWRQGKNYMLSCGFRLSRSWDYQLSPFYVHRTTMHISTNTFDLSFIFIAP